jgi:amidohydrolase
MKGIGWIVALLAASGAAASDTEELLELYRRLHAHPELSFQEERTSALLAGRMRALGFEVTERVGRYADGSSAFGVVAVLPNGAGPTVLLRTDLDALPVEERTGLAFASRERGVVDGVEVPVMHACAHDVHMSAWLGAARRLVAARESWRGTLVMIAQPAEERGAGAAAMLADGLYERFPRPDAAVALHASAELPAGTVGPRPGFMLASADSVDVVLHGVGGHGASPHTTKDPVVLAAQLVLALQTIVGRELDPFEPAVVTVGALHAGSKHNIIPDRAQLKLTVRAYRPEVRAQILAAIERLARGLAAAAGVEQAPEIRVSDLETTPSTYNDPELTRRITAALRRELGAESVREGSRIMAAEDFSRYGRVDPPVPISMFWLGIVPPQDFRRFEAGELKLPSLHSPLLAPDAATAIPTGVRALTAVALELLGRP